MPRSKCIGREAALAEANDSVEKDASMHSCQVCGEKPVTRRGFRGVGMMGV